ncbi:MAG: hypothetical protein AB1331_01025 [Bacillota bacterium]
MLYSLGLLVILAFAAEFIDSTLGMGYGTLLTPILLLMVCRQGWRAVLHLHLSEPLRIVLLFALSSLTTTIAVLLAVNLSAYYVRLYIRILVTGLGLVLLATSHRPRPFSWGRLISWSQLASWGSSHSTALLQPEQLARKPGREGASCNEPLPFGLPVSREPANPPLLLSSRSG